MAKQAVAEVDAGAGEDAQIQRLRAGRLEATFDLTVRIASALGDMGFQVESRCLGFHDERVGEHSVYQSIVKHGIHEVARVEYVGEVPGGIGVVAKGQSTASPVKFIGKLKGHSYYWWSILEPAVDAKVVEPSHVQVAPKSRDRRRSVAPEVVLQDTTDGAIRAAFGWLLDTPEIVSRQEAAPDVILTPTFWRGPSSSHLEPR